MLFTVTYRNKSGAKAEVEIEASGRAECVAECKRRGIAPIALREGRSGKSASQGSAGRAANVSAAPRGGIWKAAILAATCLVAGMAGWWWLGREEVRPDLPTVAKSKGGTSPAKPPTALREMTNNDPKDVHAPKDRKVTKGTPPNVARQPVASTNRTEITQRQVVTNVAVKTEEPEGGIQYRTCTEQILGWIFSCPDGNAPMPLPNLPPKELEHLEEILATPNLPKETDDNFVKEQKEIIQQAKIEFRKFLDEGGKPRDFLNYYHDLLINYHDQFMDAQKSVLKAVREEDPEFAREYLIKVNAQLAEKGIKPITLSRKFSERIGIEYKGKEKK